MDVTRERAGQPWRARHREILNRIVRETEPPTDAMPRITNRDRAEHDGHFHEGEDGHEHHEIPPGLAQRAYPFLDMLRAAQKENADIVWGI